MSQQFGQPIDYEKMDWVDRLTEIALNRAKSAGAEEATPPVVIAGLNSEIYELAQLKLSRKGRSRLTFIPDLKAIHPGVAERTLKRMVDDLCKARYLIPVRYTAGNGFDYTGYRAVRTASSSKVEAVMPAVTEAIRNAPAGITEMGIVGDGGVEFRAAIDRLIAYGRAEEHLRNGDEFAKIRPLLLPDRD